MKNNKKLLSAIPILAIVSVASGCATTSSQVVETPKVNTYNTQYTGEKKKLVVGQFVNRSSFQNGISVSYTHLRAHETLR